MVRRTLFRTIAIGVKIITIGRESQPNSEYKKFGFNARIFRQGAE